MIILFYKKYVIVGILLTFNYFIFSVKWLSGHYLYNSNVTNGRAVQKSIILLCFSHFLLNITIIFMM